ncbi:MAG: hypothetical protein WKF43_11150 [Acidimicrobiales bacterium]
MAEEAVGHLSGHLGHLLAHASQEDGRVAVGVRSWVEERGHERVLVEVADEVEIGVVVPAVPDRPDGEDHLPHPGRGVIPCHAESAHNVWLDL